MQRLIYIIFMMQITQLLAMDRTITVANTASEGVVVQICDPTKVADKNSGHKFWLGTIRKDTVTVAPPLPPSTMHALVVRDTQETKTLARADFPHPEKDTLFQIMPSESGVTVQEVEDPRNKSMQVSKSHSPLYYSLAVPATGALVIVLGLLALKKYTSAQ